VSADEHAARVNRVTNDPRRIEDRKRIAPALTVPRRRYIEITGNIVAHHAVKADAVTVSNEQEAAK
jgi:hypothetical protein